MKKVAIVGVEGSGKTVMLAGLGELYLRPDKNGIFLEPKNYETAAYVADKIARMRRGHWPVATPEDVMQGLDWTIRRRVDVRMRPETICQISCLDFAGEVYSAAFGISDQSEMLKNQIDTLKTYVRDADALLVLLNLKDVVARGIADRNVQKSMWITKNILDVVLDEADGRVPPRTAIVLSQADAYADTIRSCGGARETLDRYLPYVGNSYNWLDVFAVSVVDRTRLDDDGNVVPAENFTLSGVKPIIDWILRTSQTTDKTRSKPLRQESVCKTPGKSGDGRMALMKKYRLRRKLIAIAFLLFLVLFVAICGLIQSGCAQNFIADRYYESENFEKAVKWYSKAAYEGYAAAQNKLGECYLEGEGVVKDREEAVRWFRKAAEQEDARAQYNLGWCYQYGWGVQPDMNEAAKWFHKAAGNGFSGARDHLKALKTRLNIPEF